MPITRLGSSISWFRSRGTHGRCASSGADLATAARRHSQIDRRDTTGIIATTGPDNRIVGHGSYALVELERAEGGFTTADEHRGRTLGTLLLAHLAQTAAANGIERFLAVVMPAKYRMLGVLRDSSFQGAMQIEPNEIRVELPTSLTPKSRA